jgi:hypothetical protein
MDDLDRLLAETMRTAAGRAPSDGGLLTTVHERSRRYHRRRVATAASAAAVILVAGIPFGVGLVHRSQPGTPAGGSGPIVPAPTDSTPVPSGTPSPPGPTTRPPSSATSAPTSAPSSKPATAAVRLVHGFTAPSFPYMLPSIDGMRAPVASIENGTLSAFFEATELEQHADTTVTVATRKPNSPADATKTRTTVRGHAGTLWTLDARPAKQLILTWPESSTRWITLATDDTYTPEQVLALAESLSEASIAVLPPFTLDLTPAGLTADTVTASTMSFRSAKGKRVSVVLRQRQPLGASTDTVGRYPARLTRSGGAATLAVDVPDWDATLEVTVDAGLTISDADLLRFAAGIHILNRSDPK